MATAFESSLSSSISGRPTMSAAAPSMADQLPSINFGFDELRDRMAKFTARFDAFIEQGRKRVLEERNQFRMNVAELQEDQRMKRKDMEIVQHKISTHQQTRGKEDAERREMEASIAALSAQRDANLATRDALVSALAATTERIDAARERRRLHAERVAAQARWNVPELDFWIANLCLRIEGSGRPDRLRFVFTHVDERDWDREAWFELATGGRDYDVRHCRPKLERDAVDRLLERVNESRELPALLKGMRELFVEAVKA
ncbi:chromosome segregation protein Spc25-domain-containing protein [Xylariaceae sp. FL0804]|nr:chromosome segregation protein Spc25-domain-containing protein [Xylariaceae sp. FL0804]